MVSHCHHNESPEEGELIALFGHISGYTCGTIDQIINKEILHDDVFTERLLLLPVSNIKPLD